MEYISAKIPVLASAITTELVSALSKDFPSIDRRLNKDLVMELIHEYAIANFSKGQELSFIRPDFEGIKLQLIAKLRESDAWKDIIQASGGGTLIDFVASVGAYAQLSIQRALQESMLDTARLTSSIYTITRMLGVHIRRKTPAYTTARLTNNHANKFMTVPAYSQFTVNGIKFFNREAIVFTTQQPTQDVILYQGEITIEEMISNGRPFQRWELGDADFSVADIDLFCIDSNFNEYKRVEDGLWHYKSDEPIFYENTTPNGNVECLFGNGVYGKVPPIDSKLYFVYARTSGDEHQTTQLELSVNLLSVNDIGPDRIRRSSADAELTERNRVTASVTGYCLTGIEGGSQEKDAEFYRVLAPHIYSAKNRAVTRKDHYALALDCPVVPIMDVYFQGQQELDRNNRNFINVVGLTTLKKNGSPLTEAEWKRFMVWWEERAIWRVQYMRIDPRPVDLDIEATVYIKQNSDPARVRTYVEYRLSEYFKMQRGVLGRSVYQSDIYDILEAKHHSLEVDYAELTAPNIDYEVTNTQFIRLRSLKINVDYSKRYMTNSLPISSINTRT